MTHEPRSFHRFIFVGYCYFVVFINSLKKYKAKIYMSAVAKIHVMFVQLKTKGMFIFSFERPHHKVKEQSSG